MERTCRQAMAIGLPVIAFTEHGPYALDTGSDRPRAGRAALARRGHHARTGGWQFRSGPWLPALPTRRRYVSGAARTVRPATSRGARDRVRERGGAPRTQERCLHRARPHRLPVAVLARADRDSRSRAPSRRRTGRRSERQRNRDEPWRSTRSSHWTRRSCAGGAKWAGKPSASAVTPIHRPTSRETSGQRRPWRPPTASGPAPTRTTSGPEPADEAARHLTRGGRYPRFRSATRCASTSR